MENIGKKLTLVYFLCVINLCFSNEITRSSCKTIGIPMCQNVSYTETVFPNGFGHVTQEEAGYEVHQYYALVKTQCSHSFQPFLCALYAPVCNTLRKIIPPCQSLCESARAACEPVMLSYGFPWPDNLDCSPFPSGENETCFNGHSIQNLDKLQFLIYPKPPQIRKSEGRAILRNQLLGTDSKFIIPDDVRVIFEMGIYSLHVNEQMEILNVRTWIKLSWLDSHRTWDNETNQINLLHVQTQDIWTPDIVNINSVKMNKDMMDCWEGDVVLYPNGNTIWERPCQIQTYCNLNLHKIPYGEQKCEMKFGSWNYDYDLLDLEGMVIDLSDYGMNEWNITGSSAARNERYKSHTPTSYIQLTYNLTFQRIEPNNTRT